MMHACTLGWPEIPADAIDNLCGALGRSAEQLTEDLDRVTCPDCLRMIAAWGQRLGQEACGAAVGLGQVYSSLYERAAEAIAKFDDLCQALRLELVDYSAERSWCRRCRTATPQPHEPRTYRPLPRVPHHHAPGCPLYRLPDRGQAE